MDTSKATPSREKYWSEIDDAEKMKRLRERVKYLEGRLERMSNKLDRLEEHEHNNGKIVVPLNSNMPCGEQRGVLRGPNPDDVYF